MEGESRRHETYVAYMLRLWQAGSRGGLPVWRASLEDPHTGERMVFGEMQALFAFLTEAVVSLSGQSDVVGLAASTGADDCGSLPAAGETPAQ